MIATRVMVRSSISFDIAEEVSWSVVLILYDALALTMQA